MSDELTNEQLDAHIAALWISAPASKAYKAARLLKIERAKVARLEAMIAAMDRNLGDERRAHEVEIARLNEENKKVASLHRTLAHNDITVVIEGRV